MYKTREDHGYVCAQAHGDGIINYSVAFTLACNGVLMHIGTALSWVCARAPRIRLRCFSRDAVDPLIRAKLRSRAREFHLEHYRFCFQTFRVQKCMNMYDFCNPYAFGFSFSFVFRNPKKTESLVTLLRNFYFSFDKLIGFQMIRIFLKVVLES